MKRVLVVTVALTPALVALTALRPLEAATAEPFGSFGLTVTAAALRTAGDVGAGGGLATLESGLGVSVARLDSAPSSYALGSPVEPGPLARSLIGTANNEAGTEVFSVSEAESQYPGPPKAVSEYAPPTDLGPATISAGTGTSTAGPDAADGRTSGTRVDIAGLVEAAGLSSSATASGRDTAGAATASGSSAVGRISVAGVLVVDGILARAGVSAVGGRTTPTATLTVGSAKVAGVPVTIDSDGVQVAGQSGPLGPLQDAQQTVNAALAAAGLEVHLLQVTTTTSGRSGYADSGGLSVHVVTPGVDPAGLPGNELTVTFGKVTVTSTTEAAFPTDPEPPAATPGTPAIPPTTTTTTVVDGVPGSAPAPAGGPAPAVAPARQVVLAGHRVSAAAAFAGFAVWQLISMAMTTLYALADRRRRAALEVGL